MSTNTMSARPASLHRLQLFFRVLSAPLLFAAGWTLYVVFTGEPVFGIGESAEREKAIAMVLMSVFILAGMLIGWLASRIPCGNCGKPFVMIRLETGERRIKLAARTCVHCGAGDSA